MKHSLSRRLGTAAVAVALCGAPLGAQAQSAMNGPTTKPMAHGMGGKMTSNAVSAADRTFLRTASEVNNGEVAGGKLAEQRGTTPAVRNLAKRYVGDHSVNQQKLSALAARLRVSLPPSSKVTPDAEKAGMKLQNLHGAAFDLTWLSAERKGHESAIAAYKKEIGSGSNGAVVSYAKQSLPTLEQHLALAKGMGSMKASSMK